MKAPQDAIVFCTANSASLTATTLPPTVRRPSARATDSDAAAKIVQRGQSKELGAQLTPRTVLF